VVIDEVALVRDEDAFVGDSCCVDLANDIGCPPRAGNQDDVHGIVEQPVGRADHLPGARNQSTGLDWVGIHYDRKSVGI
jgi:hypothetical protein